MFSARVILEEETPKGIFRQLTTLPFAEYLEQRGFRFSHHRWWTKALPANSSGLYGVFWIEFEERASAVTWFKVVFHLVRSDRQPWSTWRTTKSNAPVDHYQGQARRLMLSLVQDVCAVMGRFTKRAVPGDIDLAVARDLSYQIAQAFREFDYRWQQMEEKRDAEPM